jgi:hypothetical protein
MQTLNRKPNLNEKNLYEVVLTATNKVQHSDSTPADETEALVDAIGRLKGKGKNITS